MGDILNWTRSYRYLSRLNAPTSAAERERIERVLGTARLLLSLLSLVAVYVDPTEPATYANKAYVMLGVWVVFSAVVMVWLRFRTVSVRMTWFLHGMDVLWPTLITLFTEGPNSPFFAFFVFALASAGFRWGFTETVGTAVVGVGLLDLEALVLSNGPTQMQLIFEGQFDVNRLIIRCAYLMTLGFLIGYLGENEKERRAESTVITRVITVIRSEHSLATGLQVALTALLQIFDARKAFVIVQDSGTSRLFVWQTPTRPAVDYHPFVEEMEPIHSEEYLMKKYPQTFYYSRSGERPEFVSGEKTKQGPMGFPNLPFYKGQARSVLSTTSLLGSDWQGRLVLVDVRLGPDKQRELRFLENLFSQAASALYSVYLVRRLRSRAGAIERARVARELHDGAIQSLISAEMQVDVLRRRAENTDSQTAPELMRIQQLLRQEVLNLRELMQQMRPVDIGPDQFLDHLADTVDRFRRDTGISATFVSDLQDVELSPHACRELARIVQEGLVNIRKHARASNVLVRFRRDREAWRLTIEDDGKGFEFSGKLSFAELNSARKGPTVIKERVRNIGGELEIESTPGRGARLQIRLPQKGQLAHGQQEQ
jgi:signal transduction histidine kinase